MEKTNVSYIWTRVEELYKGSHKTMTEPRLITPNMPPMEKFQQGDRVSHIRMGDGTVIEPQNGCVCVRYDPREGKRGPVGIYDAKWFEKNPTFLFHRS